MIRKIFTIVLVLVLGLSLTSGAEAAGGPGEGGDSVAPAAPTGVSAAGSASGITISWSAVTTNADNTAITDLNDYRVWQSTTSGSGFAAIATVTTSTGTSYLDGGTTAGTTYYYKVTARDQSANESSQSSEVNAVRPYSSGGAYVPSGGPSGSPAADTTPPTNTSIKINNDGPTVATTSVLLTLAATDASEMKISNYSAFSDGIWVPYATTKSWQLLTGDGVKIVYAQFRDTTGNISATVSDSIILTGTGVTTSTVAAAGPTVTPGAAPSAIVSKKYEFTRRLSIGKEGSDVSELQKYLASDATLYPEGTVSGYYGALTQKAVGRFQEKYGIAKAGDPGYGEVGPATRAKLNELMAGAAPAAVAAPTVAPSAVVQTVAGRITKRLVMGMQDEDVRQLQIILSADKEVYPQGITSGYYGPLTQKAVQRFQEKYGIAKAGDPGYGEVGPMTRAKLNGLAGGVGTAPALPSVPVGAPAAVSGSVAEGKFTTRLMPGMKDDAVRRLQVTLAKDAEIYPEGITSGYYGPLTQKAVQRFQEKYGIAKAGDPGYGEVGPATRAKLNELAP